MPLRGTESNVVQQADLSVRKAVQCVDYISAIIVTESARLFGNVKAAQPLFDALGTRGGELVNLLTALHTVAVSAAPIIGKPAPAPLVPSGVTVSVGDDGTVTVAETPAPDPAREEAE